MPDRLLPLGLGLLALATASGLGGLAAEDLAGPAMGAEPAAGGVEPRLASPGLTTPVATSVTTPTPLGARPFSIGERFKFSLQYGPVKAGTAELMVEGIEEVHGRPCYRLTSVAKSNVVFSAFYKVRDRVESFVDVGELLTRRSTKHLREGDYRKDVELEWDQEGGAVIDQEGERIDVGPGARDILGAFYYVRTLDLQVGDRVSLLAHDGKKTYPLWVDVLEQEIIDTPVGRFDCLVVEPRMQSEGLFNRTGSLRVWMTDDAARMPVMMQSKVKVGAISAILVDMERGRQGRSALPAADTR